MSTTSTEPTTTACDFTVQDGGSIKILRAHTQECHEWIEENVGNNETQTFGGGIVVEPRYIQDIIDGLESYGFNGKPWSLEAPFKP